MASWPAEDIFKILPRLPEQAKATISAMQLRTAHVDVVWWVKREAEILLWTALAQHPMPVLHDYSVSGTWADTYEHHQVVVGDVLAVTYEQRIHTLADRVLIHPLCPGHKLHLNEQDVRDVLRKVVADGRS